MVDEMVIYRIGQTPLSSNSPVFESKLNREVAASKRNPMKHNLLLLTALLLAPLAGLHAAD